MSGLKRKSMLLVAAMVYRPATPYFSGYRGYSPYTSGYRGFGTGIGLGISPVGIIGYE